MTYTPGDPVWCAPRDRYIRGVVRNIDHAAGVADVICLADDDEWVEKDFPISHLRHRQRHGQEL